MKLAITFEAFLTAFTVPEQLAIAGSADARVKLILWRLSAKGAVRGDDPIVINGMALLVTLGLLTQARSDAILAIVNAVGS